MKITINVNESFAETEITINCNSLNENIEKILTAIRIMDMKLTGMKDGQKHIIDAQKIIYIETVDKRTILWTDSDVFETSLKLYELEQLLQGSDFMRAGKSSLFNFNYIKSLKNELDGRIILTMENDIKVIVSRQYAPLVKRKLEDNCGK
ncbi:MAG: LytTR family transcriptional regulator DNA-binding domain-containing protein, partial [Spirochaetaceae bacterium]|jgi:DNA-binding LytR/AlgR family response regulator|nr:LytTR family transcriptional regulator DNA-binding domain-containing protein [Spirochaetaceae bacterium]